MRYIEDVKDYIDSFDTATSHWNIGTSYRFPKSREERISNIKKFEKKLKKLNIDIGGGFRFD